jgi:hypothetical protein
MHLQEETIEEAWERHPDRGVELNSQSGNLSVDPSSEYCATSNVNCALDEKLIGHGWFAW